MDDWKTKIRQNLKDFYRALEKTARKSGRGKEAVSVLFATKYLTEEKLAYFIDQYYRLRGQKVIIGENRVQDAERKFLYIDRERPDLKGKYRKVMIGNLQKNKINKTLKIFDEIWGVDSPELAGAIDKRADRIVPVFLEVNVSKEAIKHGISTDRLDEAIMSIKEKKSLKLRGLMTMAPYSDDPEDARRFFKKLKESADKYELKTSMGMSNDWREAVAEGSDYLRIGSGIFN